MKVLICDATAQAALDMISEAGIEVVNKPDITPEELLEEIAEYDAMVVRSRTKVRKPVIDAATKLKAIVRGGVGLDNIDVKYAGTKGIQVLNTPSASTAAVAELAIGYIFALARNIPQMTTSMGDGEWAKKSFSGTEIAGKVLGLVGIGRIGQSTGQKANALGMTAIAYDPFVDEADGIELVESLNDLLARADYISLHVPYTKETHNILDANAFAKMKDGVNIINCGRGGTIDEDALFDAIKSGKVAGAALDVYTEEPSMGHKLYTLDQVIGSPHIGAGTVEAKARVGTEVAKNVINALKG
ncbi:MAG: hydroxyacid dehydrogenase [Anaerolineae bacterium]|nr:hydroxyacid dehydrogenase [Anaerolineae bacterium]MBT4311581.1 hydroxyacid dehydrogenase [Anaerolineae bacterium]MBT4459104.1 hydroxyacid dehydrogenase [Anaerolineae bacterium]MBT4840933.1 hydroxyacid dehydrogenase [Anaerolineae bacterium]MBT6060697.1 hydroxyacid dehydrogenase [Anaerolineae bacterium]